MLNKMAVIHPASWVIGDKGDAYGFVFTKDNGVGLIGDDVAFVGIQHGKNHTVQVNRVHVLAGVFQFKDIAFPQFELGQWWWDFTFGHPGPGCFVDRPETGFPGFTHWSDGSAPVKGEMQGFCIIDIG